MNNESKNPTAKEAVKDQIASTLRHIERRISAMTEEMSENYFHFFERQADDMFKIQKRRAFYTHLLEEVELKEDSFDLSEWFANIATYNIMEKRTEFTRDTIEVCRNCKSEGKVKAEMFNGSCAAKITCPICGGSGLVRKHIEGFVSIEPYVKNAEA